MKARRPLPRGSVTAPRVQCEMCPWKVGVDPRAIPNGYDEAKHRALACTISSGIESLARAPKIMACHESEVGAEAACVGWLVNQLGRGNNLGVRLAVRDGRLDGNVRAVGRQHPTFAATLPRKRS